VDGDVELERIDDGAYAPPAEGAAPRKTRRGRVLVLGGALAVVALIVTALALRGDDGDREAERALARAKESLRAATSLRFSYSGAMEGPLLDEEDEYEEPSSGRFDGTGEWTPDAWHIVEVADGDTVEAIRIGDREFYRSGWEDSPIEDEAWTEWPAEPLTAEDFTDYLTFIGAVVRGEYYDRGDDAGAAAEEYGPLVALMVFLHAPNSAQGMFLADPQAFLDALQSLANPTVLSEDGDVLTLSMPIVASAELVEAYGGPIPDGTVELDLDADDRPVALRYRVAASATTVALDMSFSGRNEPLVIDAPDPSLVDGLEAGWEDILGTPDEVPVIDGATPVRIGDGAGEWAIVSAYDDDYWDDDEFGDDCRVLTMVWSEGRGRFTQMLSAVSIDLTTAGCGEQIVYDEIPEGRPGELVVVEQAGDDELLELDPDGEALDFRSWVFVADGTVGTIDVMFLRDPARVDAIIAALELTDWETLQGDLLAG
jgi:hypothetical protein